MLSGTGLTESKRLHQLLLMLMSICIRVFLASIHRWEPRIQSSDFHCSLLIPSSITSKTVYSTGSQGPCPNLRTVPEVSVFRSSAGTSSLITQGLRTTSIWVLISQEALTFVYFCPLVSFENVYYLKHKNKNPWLQQETLTSTMIVFWVDYYCCGLLPIFLRVSTFPFSTKSLLYNLSITNYHSCFLSSYYPCF